MDKYLMWMVTKNLVFVLILISFILSAQWSLHSQAAIRDGLPHNSISENRRAANAGEIDSAIVLAEAYLIRTCGSNGRFVYRVETDAGVINSSYNIIRHAGAMYALGSLYRVRPDAQTASALVRSATYLTQKYIAPGPRPGQLTVWSRPVSRVSDADLGATGLALAAFAEVNQARPGTVPTSRMQALGRFLLFLQKDDGSFYSKYRTAAGPDGEWESLYYPGEAALGLIALYETDHSKEWLFAAAKALAYLAHVRQGLPDASIPPDHWALIATARLLPHCTDYTCPVSRAVLIAHAEKVCRSLLQGQLIHPAMPSLDGSFDTTGRTAPTATRMEGLLAALEFLPNKENADLRARVEDAAEHGVAFLLRAQVHSGPFAGGVPGAVGIGSKASSEIRIDFVQHALCAWLRYQGILRSSVSKISSAT
ncbi:MAG TPA: hypothetical protein VFB43_06620 [Terracidiphilus sp.]|nr:hypothetical protein [Terracidiphilus sp.]